MDGRYRMADGKKISAIRHLSPKKHGLMTNRSTLWLLLGAAALLAGCEVEAPSPVQLHSYSVFASFGLTNTEIIERFGPPHNVPISLVNKHGQKIEYCTYSFYDSTHWDPTNRWHVTLTLVDDVRAIGGSQRRTDILTNLFGRHHSWPLDWEALRIRAYENRVAGPQDSSFHAMIRSLLERPPDPRF